MAKIRDTVSPNKSNANKRKIIEEKLYKKKASEYKKSQVQTKSDQLKKIKILVSIIERGKKELFIDLIEKYEVNVQLHFLAHGTATDEIISILGLDSLEKDIIFSAIREEKVKDCILELEDKIKAKKMVGVFFSIPMESIIGNSNYLLLSNLGRSENIGK